MEKFSLRFNDKIESKIITFRIKVEYLDYIYKLSQKYDISPNKIINKCIEYSYKYMNYSKNHCINNNIFNANNKKSEQKNIRLNSNVIDILEDLKSKGISYNHAVNQSIEFALNNLEIEKEEVYS